MLKALSALMYFIKSQLIIKISTMKYSSVMHATMIVAGIAGGIALLGAWIAGEGGIFLGLSAGFFYTNALNLQIVAISAGICTLVRRNMEKENPGSFF